MSLTMTGSPLQEVNEEEVMRLVYFGGVAHEIRQEVRLAKYMYM